MLVRSLPVLAYELVWFPQCASPAKNPKTVCGRTRCRCCHRHCPAVVDGGDVREGVPAAPARLSAVTRQWRSVTRWGCRHEAVEKRDEVGKSGAACKTDRRTKNSRRGRRS